MRVVLGLLIAAVAAVCVRADPSVGGETLLDFEQESERAAVPFRNVGNVSVMVTNRLAVSGNHAVRFAVPPFRKGMEEWPGFTLASPRRDWRGYDRLVVEVVNASVANDGSLKLYISGPDGRIQNGLLASLRNLPSKGHVQWIVPLSALPEKISPANIARLRFFVDAVAQPDGYDLTIDGLALLKPGEPPPTPSGAGVLRDLLPMVEEERESLRRRADELSEENAHLSGLLCFAAACDSSRVRSPDMLVGWATSMEHVRPRGAFEARAIPSDGLKVRLARNEYECVQVVVSPRNRDLTGVRVKVDGELGGFPVSNVSCSAMGYVRTMEVPPYGVGVTVPTNTVHGYVRTVRKPKPGWWPDPILDFLDGVDVKRHDVQSFWVCVHAPSGQKAGTYRGFLTVSADGIAAIRIPFAVRVNDFALGRVSPLPLAITFAPETRSEDARKNPESPVNAWRRHIDKWTDFLADHLITIDSLYHWHDLWRIRQLERLERQGRLGHFNLGYWSYPADGKETVEAWQRRNLPRLEQFYRAAKERNILDRAYVYGCDEVHAEHFTEIARAVAALKTALPGVPVATTAYDGAYGVGTALGDVDWFTPLTPSYDAAKADVARAQGHRVWWYVCMAPKAPRANMFVECQPIEGRLLMGAQSVRMKPDGFLYYQISIWNSSRCITSGPFTDWTPRSWRTYNGDGSWTCVGPDGTPLSTVRLENFRDGLEDYAYAVELERKLNACQDKDSDWARQARELLDVPSEVMIDMQNFTDSPDAVMYWRDGMADLIESAGTVRSE